MDEDNSTPTIRNATCASCGAAEQPFRVTGRQASIEPESEEPEDSFVRRTVVCEHCDAEAIVEVTRAGTSITGPLVPSWMDFEEGAEQAESGEESEPVTDEGPALEEDEPASQEESEELSEAQEALFG